VEQRAGCLAEGEVRLMPGQVDVEVDGGGDPPRGFRRWYIGGVGEVCASTSRVEDDVGSRALLQQPVDPAGAGLQAEPPRPGETVRGGSTPTM
jgi:hypothetical protein